MRDAGFPSIGVPVEANEMAIHDAEGGELAAGANAARSCCAA